DRNVRLIAHQPHRFICPPGKAKPELYTHISIDALAGRSLKAKRNLYQAIVKNLEPLGIPKDHVKILVRDVPTTNWGVRGGQAACDVVLVFLVDVKRGPRSRARSQGSSASDRPDATSEEKPMKESAIWACEERLRIAQLESDVAELARLLDDELMFTALDGSVVGKRDDLELHRSG